MRRILDFLQDPLLNGMDVDGDNRLELHKEMLQKKRMVRELFLEFHHLFKNLNRKFLSGNGIEIELGAGVAPIRDSYPEVLATDIVDAPHLDLVLNAESMDIESETVRVVYGQNCFHHFPHPDRFFVELERVLVPGGGAILLEPNYGPFATFLFKRLFRTEGFDKYYPSWDTPVSGPMNGANQALSYIVFVRDRAEFERKHPRLKIVHEQKLLNYVKYIVSGGLNFRQLLPDFSIPLVNATERILAPLKSIFALHHIVVIKKIY